MKVFDVAIIGAGPVGLFSVFQAGMNGLTSCVIDVLSNIGGQCSTIYAGKPVYDIPGFDIIVAQKLVYNLQKQIRPFPYKIFLNQCCLNLEKAQGIWKIKCTNIFIFAKTIIIAAGAGSFKVRKPPITDIHHFENKTVFYNILNKRKLYNKIVAVTGGGNSALDCSIFLANNIANKVLLVHRRNNFSAFQKTLNDIKYLSTVNKIEIITPYKIMALYGHNGYLRYIKVQSLDRQEILILRSDILLSFFGMSMSVEPINNWGVAMIEKYIKVSSMSMETNCSGIYAVGDICYYPGKLKFIATGFAESIRAIYSVYQYIYPSRIKKFEHSTVTGVSLYV